MSAHLERDRSLAVLTYPIPLDVVRALSRAELEIALLLADGLSYADIAARRRAATRTVANQVAGLYRKLRVRSRRECVLRLYGGRCALVDARMLEVVHVIADSA